MLRGTLKGRRTSRKLPLFENGDFGFAISLFLVPLMIPKVCESKGKHWSYLQNVFLAIFKRSMLLLKLPPTKCNS